MRRRSLHGEGIVFLIDHRMSAGRLELDVAIERNSYWRILGYRDLGLHNIAAALYMLSFIGPDLKPVGRFTGHWWPSTA